MDPSPSQSALISDMLDPLTEAFTPELAERVAHLKAKPAVQARLDALAQKCSEGDLTDAEREEYESYVTVGNVLNILKAKAKQVLAEGS